MGKRGKPVYEAYCIKYDFVKSGIRAKNTYMTAKYTEQEFNELYNNIREKRVEWKNYSRDRIVQYIVYRQKRFYDLI